MGSADVLFFGEIFNWCKPNKKFSIPPFFNTLKLF